MKIKFFKYQGTGNDFIIIDNRDFSYEGFSQEEIRFLCDRHFGIGADGLMLLQYNQKYDFEMKYYNSDGNESTMCGNGGRCIVHFASKINLIQEKCHFLAIDGVHVAEINGDMVKLKMSDVKGIQKVGDSYFLNTGSPHHVQFVDHVENYDVFQEGRRIRNNEKYRGAGTNVNFVSVKKDMLLVRTYERGVENETLSCGTGVTASAIATAFHLGKVESPYRISTPGGKLKVYFDQETPKRFNNIWLEGPANFVFHGEVLM